MKPTKRKFKNKKKYTKKYKKNNKAGTYENWLKTLTPDRLESSIPPENIAEAAASLIQDKYSSRLDKKFQTCGVCLDRIIKEDDEMLLTCSPTKSHRHSFHKKCIKGLIDQGHRKCPSCRREPIELNNDLTDIKNEIVYRMSSLERNFQRTMESKPFSRLISTRDQYILISNVKINAENLFMQIFREKNILSPVNKSKIYSIISKIYIYLFTNFNALIEEINLINNMIFTQKGTIIVRIGKDQLNRIKILYIKAIVNLYFLLPWINPIPNELKDLLIHYSTILKEKGVEILSFDNFLLFLEDMERTDIELPDSQTINLIERTFDKQYEKYEKALNGEI